MLSIAFGALAIISLSSSAGASGSPDQHAWHQDWGDAIPTTTIPASPLPKPSISFIGPSQQTIRVSGISNEPGHYRGTIDLLIQNSGETAVNARLSIYGDPTIPGAVAIMKATGGCGPNKSFVLLAYRVTTKPCVINTQDIEDTNVTIVLTVLDPTGAAPSSEVFKVQRKLPSTYIWGPVLAGAVFALLFFIVRGIAWRLGLRFRLRFWNDRLGSAERVQWGRRLYSPPSWTFAGNWVTVVSVLGALLATILGSTGVIADLFPSIDVQRFGVLNLVLVGIVLLGPMVYSALSTYKQPRSADGSQPAVGTAAGLLFAATVTLMGVGGQIATLAALANLSNAEFYNIYAAYAVASIAAIVLFWFALRSIDQLARNPMPPIPPSAPSPIDSVAAHGGPVVGN